MGVIRYFTHNSHFQLARYKVLHDIPVCRISGIKTLKGETRMHAAVLHTIGTVPRYEEFPEPVIGDKDGEVIVHVHASSLKPVDKQLANGSHYASRGEFPRVCGSDGVGHLDDGRRVFFGGPRPPHGAMAQRTVVPRAFTFPIPEDVDDEIAAALPNPAVSAWLS